MSRGAGAKPAVPPSMFSGASSGGCGVLLGRPKAMFQRNERQGAPSSSQPRQVDQGGYLAVLPRPCAPARDWPQEPAGSDRQRLVSGAAGRMRPAQCPCLFRQQRSARAAGPSGMAGFFGSWLWALCLRLSTPAVASILTKWRWRVQCGHLHHCCRIPGSGIVFQEKRAAQSQRSGL